MRIRDRGAALVHLGDFVRQPAQFLRGEPDTGVADAIYGDPVGDRVLRHGRLETIRLSHDPTGHIPSVGKAAATQAVRVGNAFLDGKINARYQVLIVQVAIITDDFGAKLVAVASGATIVDKQHRIACAGQHLKIKGEHVTTANMWPTVDV